MHPSEPLIRKMTLADLNDLYALLSDSEVMRFIEPTFSKEQTAQFLMDAGLSENPLVYAVEDSSSFIGYVIFHDYDEDNMEIGWILKREVWGQGYASLLTKMLIDKSRKLGKGSIIECDPRQAVTKHIAKKHGFVFSGKRDGCDVYKLSNSH